MAQKIKDLRVVVRLKNNQLVERREELGVTIAMMASLIGINKSSYGMFENLQQNPVSGTTGTWVNSAVKIAEYYEVDPEELWPDWVTKLKSTYTERCLDVEGARYLLTGAYTQQGALPLAEELLNKIQLSQRLSEVLDTMPARERAFLMRSFGVGCEKETKSEIARKEGLSTQRVNQIVSKAHRMMRHSSRSNELAGFIDGGAPAELEAERAERLRCELFAHCEAVYRQALKKYTAQKWLKPVVFKRWGSPQECWQACSNSVTRDEIFLDFLEDQFYSGRVSKDAEREEER